MPETASPLSIDDDGDAISASTASALSSILTERLVEFSSLPDSPQAVQRAIALVTASMPEDFASLEALMRQLGGDYAASDAEFNVARRWWRSVPQSNRPEFAVSMTDNQWEQWINRSGPAELTRLPDDTRAPIRTIDRDRIQSATFDTLESQTIAAIDTTIREIAREMGFANAENSPIVGFQGRLRYRPRDEGEPHPSPVAVVFIPGITTDDRDFVAAYIFGYREPTGWFPYFVRCLSQHRETTPPQRQIPFVPAF